MDGPPPPPPKVGNPAVPAAIRFWAAGVDAMLTIALENLRAMTETMMRKLEEEYANRPFVPPPPPPMRQQEKEDYLAPPTVVDEEEQVPFQPLFGSPPRTPPFYPPFYPHRQEEKKPSSSSSSSDDSDFGDSSSSSSFSSDDDDEEEKEEERPKRRRNPDAFVVSDDVEVSHYSKETERRHEERKRLRTKRPPSKLVIEGEEEDEEPEEEEDDSGQQEIDLFEDDGSHVQDKISKEDLHQMDIVARSHNKWAPWGDWWYREFGEELDMIRDNLGHQAKNEGPLACWDAIVKGCANKNESQLPHLKQARKMLKPETCCFCNQTKPCRQMLVVPGNKEGTGGYIAANCAKLASAVIEFYQTFYESARNKESPKTMLVKLRKLHRAISAAHADKANFHRNKKQK